MSTIINDGGPAFPTVDSTESPNHPGLRDVYACPGMTMRQYYKAAALQIIDSRYTNCGNENACISEISRFAGRLADELIAEDAEHAKKETP